MPSYRRLTYEDRCKMDAYLQEGYSKNWIAQKIGFHPSSIGREIKRNFLGMSYLPSVAQSMTVKRRKNCRKKSLISADFGASLEVKILEGWSPEQIAGRFKNEQAKTISFQTLYRYLNKSAPIRVGLRRYGKRGAGRSIQRRSTLERGLSIQNRPDIVSTRKRCGDWERDTLYGANRAQMLVCVDRRSKMIKLCNLGKWTAEGVAQATQDLLQSTGKRVFSVTNDNGSEFRKSKILKVPTYFCDPGRPQQRGTVENTIGLIRQYITTKTDLSELTQEDITSLEDRLNFRPRKCLGYLTPYEVFYKVKIALAM